MNRYLGRDKYGSNVLVDFDKRTDDKTNSNVLILGNSGQGKSYLMKLLLCNQREAGKSILCLDPEHEYEDLCRNLGGTYIDMMSGEYMINPLEPKSWGEADRSEDAPETFRRVTRLSQHISYLKGEKELVTGGYHEIYKNDSCNSYGFRNAVCYSLWQHRNRK